jgi:predicted O-methyltransferase YrrM
VPIKGVFPAVVHACESGHFGHVRIRNEDVKLGSFAIFSDELLRFRKWVYPGCYVLLNDGYAYDSMGELDFSIKFKAVEVQEENSKTKLDRSLLQVLSSLSGFANEAKKHRHEESERAGLFSCLDGGSTEIEYLNLINALVMASKPKNCLETGGYFGFGTIAILHAIKSNGIGRLTTIDNDASTEHKRIDNISRADVGQPEFVKSDSIEWINSYSGDKFDFVFFDSDVHIRGDEFSALKDKGLLEDGCLCVFHDSSRVRLKRYGDNDKMNAVLDASGQEGIEIPLSRGMRVIRIKM